MKIATYNINDIHRRMSNLLAWLAETRPDAVCLQELKTTRFPQAEIEAAGYGAVWEGEARWNGVAILARGTTPSPTRRALPGDPTDRQSRYIEAAVQGVVIGCLYAPNGNPQPGPKFDYPRAWNERLLTHAAALLALGVPAVLAGDFNIVPTDADIYNVRSWRTNALLQPGPRAQFGRLLAQGWADALKTGQWTFWSYLRDAWARDAGMRLDHLLLSPALTLVGAGVDRAVRGHEGASDHAPAWIATRAGSSLGP